MIEVKEHVFSINMAQKQFLLFLTILEELSKITTVEKKDDKDNDNNRVKIVQLEEGLYFYSANMGSENQLSQLKDCLVPKEELDLSFPLDLAWIILNPSKIHKSLSAFKKEKSISIEFSYREGGSYKIMDNAQFKSKKIKMNCSGTNQNNIEDITPSMIDEQIEQLRENSYSFIVEIDKEDFEQLKVVSNITKQEQSYRASIKNGTMKLTDENDIYWELTIKENLDEKIDDVFFFPKNILEKFKKDENLTMEVFEDFGVIQLKNIRLFFSFELENY